MGIIEGHFCQKGSHHRALELLRGVQVNVQEKKRNAHATFILHE